MIKKQTIWKTISNSTIATRLFFIILQWESKEKFICREQTIIKKTQEQKKEIKQPKVNKYLNYLADNNLITKDKQQDENARGKSNINFNHYYLTKNNLYKLFGYFIYLQEKKSSKKSKEIYLTHISDSMMELNNYSDKTSKKIEMLNTKWEKEFKKKKYKDLPDEKKADIVDTEKFILAEKDADERGVQTSFPIEYLDELKTPLFNLFNYFINKIAPNLNLQKLTFTHLSDYYWQFIMLNWNQIEKEIEKKDNNLHVLKEYMEAKYCTMNEHFMLMKLDNKTINQAFKEELI